MLTIIIIIVQYINDTMLHSLYLKINLLEKSSNNTSQGSLGFIQSNFPWYVPHGHYKSKLCSLWVNLIAKVK